MKRSDRFNDMKIVPLSTLTLCLALTALSAELRQPAAAPRLAGIVSVGARPCAVLDMAGLDYSPPRWLILSTGQRDLGVEVTGITPDRGIVDLVREGANSEAVRLANPTNLPVPGVVLENVGLDVVLQLFGQFTNRTLLRWPVLPRASFHLRASVQDRLGAAKILAQALAAKELAIIPDGEKFLMIVPKSEAASVNPHAPRAKPSAGTATKPQQAPSGTAGEEQEPLLPGMIDFRNADVAQVLPIYAEIVHRTLEPGRGRSAHGTITLTSQNRLTFEEAAYAVETVLLWSGIKMVPVGKDAIKPVPTDGD